MKGKKFDRARNQKRIQIYSSIFEEFNSEFRTKWALNGFHFPTPDTLTVHVPCEK